MKTNLAILTLGLACSLAAFAQDNVVVVETNNVEVSATAPAADAAPIAETPATEASPTNAPADVNEPPTEAPTVVGEVSEQPEAPVMDVIIDDVLLTDAIKNLARQAGLNYMLDPKLAYGQPGPDGRIVPQPMVSIRWEKVTAQQALLALLSNHGLQLVPDAKTGISRITVKDPAAPDPLQTKIIRLNYASPQTVIVAVQTALTDRRSKVVGDVRTSQLVVVATERELEAVDKLVERLDTPTKQVLIEARLLETSVNPTTKKGIDWTGTLAGQKLAFGNNLKENQPAVALNPTLATSAPRLLFDTASGFSPATAFLDADGVNAVFSFLNTDSEAKVISAPRTVTLDNETAMISVTRAFPIFKNTAGTQGSPGGSEVTYTNLGVILNVTPRISANNYVNLKVLPEVSRVFDVDTKVVAGTINEANIYDMRKLETQVMIPSGNTLVLGGLVQDDIRNSHTKVPLLGDIPGLGRAFRSDSKQRNKNNLLIFITPTIVEDGDFRPTKSDFLQAPMQTTEDKEWTALDSGKPYDWSTLMPKKKETVVPAE